MMRVGYDMAILPTVPYLGTLPKYLPIQQCQIYTGPLDPVSGPHSIRVLGLRYLFLPQWSESRRWSG